jgi:tight adherence protein B
MLIISVTVAFVSMIVVFVVIWGPLQEQIEASQNRSRSEMTQRLDEMFVFIPVEYLGTLRAGCAVLFGIAGFLLGFRASQPGPFVISAIAALFGFFFPQLMVYKMVKARRKKFAEQLVDGLVLLSNGLRAGLTMQQALEILVEDCPAPLSQEFDLVLREYRVGVELDLALTNCAKRTQDQDLELATTAVSVTRRLGGNLAEIFDRLVTMIKARKMLEGKVEALTAQGKMQAVIVALMPYLFGLLSFKINPELMGLMYTTLPGLVALGVVIILDVSGYLWVLKITDVKY